MKVPVYQPNVSYERAYARTVTLAAPGREEFAENKWSSLARAGDMMQALYALPGAAKRNRQAYQQASQTFQENLTSLVTPQNQTQEPARQTAFSSSARREQLQFARAQAAQPGAQTLQRNKQDSTPVEKLDEHFLQSFSAGGNNGEAEDLLTQDYVILRREMQYLQDKTKQQTAKENFRQASGTFIQTAALVRTPQALESYITNNLSAAEKEAAQAGLQQEYHQNKDTLFTQAVRHNVQAALQAGETTQARAVQQYFAAKLSPQDNALLQRKIDACTAEQQAGALWPQARLACTDENGATQREALQTFVQKNSPEKDERYRQDLQNALQARLSEEKRKDLRREAQSYRRLLNAQNTQDMTALLEEDGFTQKDFEDNQQALHLWQTKKQKPSSCDVFNRLQNMIWQGKDPKEQLTRFLQEGTLSAPDYWRLKARSASAQADGSDIRERLLSHSLKRFCQSLHLTPQETEEIHYFVFASSDDVQQQLDAAGTVRRIFQLQEKKQ